MDPHKNLISDNNKIMTDATVIKAAHGEINIH